MSTVDRVSGDWYLKSLNGDIYLDARGGNGVITLLGDVVVTGTQTSVGSVNTLLADNIITLCANITSGEPILNAGIEVLRGDEPAVGFLWVESIKKWQVSEDGLYYGNLLVRLQDDASPRLGGDLFTDGFHIRSVSNQNIVLHAGPNSGIEIKETVGNATPELNSTILSARTPDLGKTGLYVTNFVSDNEELITKRKSLVYSLVL
jgi:hypothetical protein